MEVLFSFVVLNYVFIYIYRFPTSLFLLTPRILIHQLMQHQRHIGNNPIWP